MASACGFPASFYGEPGVLGLLANGISAFLVLLQNFHGARTGILAEGVENILAGLFEHQMFFLLNQIVFFKPNICNIFSLVQFNAFRQHCTFVNTSCILILFVQVFISF